MIKLEKGMRLVFIGDSITDCQRSEYFGANLGQGYVNMIAGHLFRQYFHYRLEVINQGIGGNQLNDLVDRWDEDSLAFNPDILTIQIGINDIWSHNLNHPAKNSGYSDKHLECFITQYRELLRKTRQQLPDTSIILMEPFLIPITNVTEQMLPDVEAMGQAIAKLAKEEQISFVKTHTIMNRLANGLGADYVIAPDGIHPTSFGHAHLAERWLVTASL